MSDIANMIYPVTIITGGHTMTYTIPDDHYPVWEITVDDVINTISAEQYITDAVLIEAILDLRDQVLGNYFDLAEIEILDPTSANQHDVDMPIIAALRMILAYKITGYQYLRKALYEKTCIDMGVMTKIIANIDRTRLVAAIPKR